MSDHDLEKANVSSSILLAGGHMRRQVAKQLIGAGVGLELIGCIPASPPARRPATRAAIAAGAVIPVMILAIAIQKYLVRGLTFGVLKR